MCSSSARATPGSRPRWRRRAWARETAMLTQNLDTIGQMSCNPAVGGLAKGHMVREIDALGGAMGLNADATAIQCRMLNASKGPSVRGPRSQCDKKAYQFRLKAVCESQERLDLHQGSVARLLVGRRATASEGVETHARRAAARADGGHHDGDVHARAAARRACKTRRAGAWATRASAQRRPARARVRGRRVSRRARPAASTGAPSTSPSANRTPATSRRRRFRSGRNGCGRGPRDLFTLNEWRDGVFHVEQIPCWTTADQRAHARHHPRQPRQVAHVLRADRGRRAALLPVHRGQGGQVRRQDRRTSFSSNPRAGTRASITSTASRRACPSRCSLRSSTPSPGWSSAEIIRPGYAVEYDYCPPTQLRPHAGNQARGEPVLRRADQRHERLRGSRRAGHRRRDQRGAEGARRRRGVRAAARRRRTSACSSTTS